MVEIFNFASGIWYLIYLCVLVKLIFKKAGKRFVFEQNEIVLNRKERRILKGTVAKLQLTEHTPETSSRPQYSPVDPGA